MNRRRTSQEPEPHKDGERAGTELPGADDDPKQAPAQEQKEREALKHLRHERHPRRS